MLHFAFFAVNKLGLMRFAGLKSQSENEIESEFSQLTFFFILILFLALNKKTSCLCVSYVCFLLKNKFFEI